MGTKAETRFIVRLLMPFLEQAVTEMIASEMEDVRAETFWHGKSKSSLDGISYKLLLRGKKIVKCYVFRKLQPTAEEFLRLKVLRDRVRRSAKE